MIKYYRLFDLLNRRGMKKTDLLEIISSPTLAKLSKGEVVKTDIIDKICLFLGCQPEDIMEVLTEVDEINDHSRIIEKPEIIDPLTGKSKINTYGEIEDPTGFSLPHSTKMN